MFSKFFIDRPVFAGVIAIVIAGLVASAILPIAQYPDIAPPTVIINTSYPGASAETIAQYPNIAPPTVIINTSYPGASAETIAQTVAAPIEERLSGVENLLYFNSTSSSTGDMSITAPFEVGTNIDTAVFNVNNRVQLALPRLPDEVRRNGVTVQKRSQDILLLVALVSPDNSRDVLFLSNYATITLVDELKRVPGVADVTAVIAIVLVLCAVFVPVAFLTGIAGQLYRQFAVTVAIAVVISGFTALTLTPTLCALLLRDATHDPKWFRWFNRAFGATTQQFLMRVGQAPDHRGRALLIFAGVLALAGFLFWRIPGSFVPPEDQGYLIGSVQLPDGATLERTGQVSSQVKKMLTAYPELEYVNVINGNDIIGGGMKSSAGTVFIVMKRWNERDAVASDTASRINRQAQSIRNGQAIAFNPPAIRGLGTAGGFELYLQSRGGADPQRLAQVLKEFQEHLAADPALAGINTFYRAQVPQLRVEVDREKALALGVPVNEVFEALQSTMGTLYVNDFNGYGRTFRIQVPAEAPFRNDPNDLGAVYVRSQTSGQMVPLKALMDVREIVGPELLERFNGYIAARMNGSGKPGVSSGDAIKAVEDVARATLPKGFQIAWTGQAYQEKRTGSSSAFAFVFAIVMVFLILAALYGRWLLPISVLLAVPFAALGALGFVGLRGMNNDIYFQIGLVVLIGLAAKNAILIVEFAQRGFLEGRSAIEAAKEAARLRFRPIVMTSLAFVLGVVPLVIATGAGAAARQSMGTGVFGGMILATFVATVFVPLFFVLVARRGHAAEPARGAEISAPEQT